MEVVVEQNTQEWMGLRRGNYGVRIGGSEAGKACHIDKNQNPHEFYLTILLPSKPKESAATKHGHRCEDMIAERYVAITGNKIKDGNYWICKEFPDLYGASPDRKVYNDEDQFIGILEIKAPHGPMYTEPKPEHIAQMMLQVFQFSRFFLN